MKRKVKLSKADKEKLMPVAKNCINSSLNVAKRQKVNLSVADFDIKVVKDLFGVEHLLVKCTKDFHYSERVYMTTEGNPDLMPDN